MSDMKKIYYTILILPLLLVQSCGFLDFDETSGLYEKEDIYRYFDRTKNMLTYVYSYMPSDFGSLSNAMRDCGSDDAEYADPSNTVQRFNNGNWTAINTVDTQWSLYNGVRGANEFLENIDDVDFSMYESDPSYANWMEQLAYFPYEARVLRAYFFFELARRYGDIAMPLKKLTVDEVENFPKTSFGDVISFIVSECDECAPNLPESYLGNRVPEFGRVTKGFAMALKAKALLYAASPLHNESMDKAKWEAAAKASLDIINLGIYSLDPEDKCNNSYSPEIVLMRMYAENSNFELYNFPLRFTEGDRTVIGGNHPTQNLVDAFQTVNGYDVVLTEHGWVCDDPEFDPERPYDNRDPRFYRTVLANGMEFKGSEIQVYEGGADYAATLDRGMSPTGYFLRKYIVEETSFTPEAELSARHYWVIYRYAETLLSYAEAMIEAFDSPDYKDVTFTMSAAEALNQVRANAGMPEVTVKDKQAFVDAVRREWRVEFAFEDHRFWDVRRWCIGQQTQTGVDGVRILNTEDGLEYSRFTVEDRVWNDKMNLYPIPQTELFNNEGLAPQNPGW